MRISLREDGEDYVIALPGGRTVCLHHQSRSPVRKRNAFIRRQELGLNGE